MRLFGYEFRRAPETRASAEDPRVPVSAANFLQFFGLDPGNLPAITYDNAMRVPAVSCAVGFLSRSLAAVPLHAYRKTSEGPKRIEGGLETLIHEAPNAEWTSFDWRTYMWQQVFTSGRGLSWIERSGSNIVGIWPMDPAHTTIRLVNGRRVYQFWGRSEAYPAADVIDIPFMLRPDQVRHYSPVMDLAGKAIQLAIAMNDFGSSYFAGGGVPPLAVKGPVGASPEALGRAHADIKRAIDTARKENHQIVQLPPLYELVPIGYEPEKGQLTDARRFQIEEFSRVWGLPPIFLQDLTHGTFNNTEQQDLQLVKHALGQWVQRGEQEMNLKLFGQRNGNRYVEHNLDGLLRGDFKSRIEALARGVQTALITPDEGRALDGRRAMPGGDRLYIQGATVPLEEAGPAAAALAAANAEKTTVADGGANGDGA